MEVFSISCLTNLLSNFLDVADFIEFVCTHPIIVKYAFNNIKYCINTNDVNFMIEVKKYFNKSIFNVSHDNELLNFIQNCKNQECKTLIISSIINLKIHSSFDEMNDIIMRQFTNLTNLEINSNKLLSCYGLKPLLKLKKLRLYNVNFMDNKTINIFTNLTWLELFNCNGITNITKLTNITTLGISYNNNISNKCVIKMTQLTELHLWNNNVITEKTLKKLTNITSIDLSNNIFDK